MRKITKLFWTAIVVFGLLSSCERDARPEMNGFDCQECYQDKPEMGPLNVTLTINDENPYVPLVIYIGRIEDNNIEYVDTSFSEDYWVNVPVDKYYSVTAEYNDGGKKTIAVDGDKFRLKYSEKDCNEPCYYFAGGYYDLKLRRK